MYSFDIISPNVIGMSTLDDYFCMGTLNCSRSLIYKHREYEIFIKILIVITISTNVQRPYVCDH